MKQTYSKKYVTPAILLIVALMAGVLYQLAVVRVPFAWMTQYLLSYGIAFLLMALMRQQNSKTAECSSLQSMICWIWNPWYSRIRTSS